MRSSLEYRIKIGGNYLETISLTRKKIKNVQISPNSLDCYSPNYIEDGIRIKEMLIENGFKNVELVLE